MSIASHPVNNLARFNSNPQKEYWIALKRVIRYLKGTIIHGIPYKQNVSQTNVLVIVMQIGLETSQTESQLQAKFFYSVVELYLEQQLKKAKVHSIIYSRSRVCMHIWCCPEMHLAKTARSRARKCFWRSNLNIWNNKSPIGMAKNPQFHSCAKYISSFHLRTSSSWDHQTWVLFNSKDDCWHDDERTEPWSNGIAALNILHIVVIWLTLSYSGFVKTC